MKIEKLKNYLILDLTKNEKDFNKFNYKDNTFSSTDCKIKELILLFISSKLILIAIY